MRDGERHEIDQLNYPMSIYVLKLMTCELTCELNHEQQQDLIENENILIYKAYINHKGWIRPAVL